MVVNRELLGVIKDLLEKIEKVDSNEFIEHYVQMREDPEFHKIHIILPDFNIVQNWSVFYEGYITGMRTVYENINGKSDSGNS